MIPFTCELIDNCLQVEKNVFVIFYSGERAKNKVVKICEAFAANRYPFADDTGKQFQMITEVCQRQSFGTFICMHFQGIEASNYDDLTEIEFSRFPLSKSYSCSLTNERRQVQ